jgi:uncharacterized Ntn-hydrolase superfamily protein
MPHPSTFSIVAFDPNSREWGVAVASKFPAVGSVVPWAKAEIGAVATQSFANTSFGPDGLDLMAEGATASEALARLLENDPGREQRQVGLVDAKGNSATFSGKECHDWAGGLTGPGYSIQGNILTGPNVVETMQTNFLKTSGDLAARLQAALLAGDRAGGDKRGRQSAAILVVQQKGGYGGFNDRKIDYRVDDAEDPVVRLGDLIGLHRLYFDKSPVEDRIRLDGKLPLELQSMMTNLGYFKGALTGQYDIETIKSLTEFMGNENFEERANIDEGWIDRPVLEYLRQKFGSRS